MALLFLPQIFGGRFSRPSNLGLQGCLKMRVCALPALFALSPLRGAPPEGEPCPLTASRMLQADAKGVVTENLRVRKHLNIGDHARFENYEGGTACFFIE